MSTNSIGAIKSKNFSKFFRIDPSNKLLKRDGTIEFLETDINDNCLPKGSDYISVATGWLHILALRSNGTICVKQFTVNDSWGLNSNAPNSNNFIAIAAHDGNAAALTDDGIICVWGKGCDKMKKISAKDCIDIVMSDRIIVGLTSNGNAVRYSLLDRSLSIFTSYNFPMISTRYNF